MCPPSLHTALVRYVRPSGVRFAVPFSVLALACAAAPCAQPVTLVEAFPALRFSSPVELMDAGDGTNYLYVAEKGGDIRLFENGADSLGSALFIPGAAPLGPYEGTVSALTAGGGTHGVSDAFVFEVLAGTAAEPSGVEPIPAAVSPNPATSGAALGFTLDAPAAVRVALYDVLGREVAVVAAGILAAGVHRVPLDVALLPAGVYVWRLAASEHVEAGRVTVVR